jgi:hypothetical protein
MSVPVNRARAQTSITVCLLCLIAGLCLTAAGIAVAVEFSRAEIHLRRESGAVAGTMRWVLAGVPIFWRSLDGLTQVDRGDYQVRESESGSGSPRPLKNVARVVFRDHGGHQLAWSERTAIVNEVEPLQRFLRQATVIEADSDAKSMAAFTFIETPRGTTWDRIEARVVGVVFVTILALAGLLCAFAGLLSLYQRVAEIMVLGYGGREKSSSV